MSAAWYDSYSFHFNALIECSSNLIRNEALLLMDQGAFEPHLQSEESSFYIEKLAASWQVFRLLTKGVPASNSWQAPYTTQLLSSFPQITNCRHGLAYFSLIPAGGTVLSHRSEYQFRERIRHQLCLMNSGPDATITVNGETRAWSEGKVLTFDDAHMHCVQNLEDSPRLVLLYDSKPDPSS